MNKDIWGKLKKLPPVVLGLNLFIGLSFINWSQTIQKLYFVFGIIVLYLLSLLSKPKRQLTDWRISLFALWALLMMFLHAQIWKDSFTYRYLNLYLMSEGFIHVFMAVLFYKLIYEYIDRLPAVWFALAIYLGKGFLIKSLTPISAVVICSLIYCVAKRKWLIFSMIALWSFFLIWVEWDYICLKWQARAFAWPYTIKEIIQHPFIGTGFDKNIMINLIPGRNGWCYRHNDFLNIAKDLGLPALIIIGIFLRDFFKKFKFELLSIICLGTILIMGAQTSAYFPRFSILMISLWALWRIHEEKTRICR